MNLSYPDHRKARRRINEKSDQYAGDGQHVPKWVGDHIFQSQQNEFEASNVSAKKILWAIIGLLTLGMIVGIWIMVMGL